MSCDVSETVLNVTCIESPMIASYVDAFGILGVMPHVKVFCILKWLSHGTSYVSSMDYFGFSKSSMSKYVIEFFRVILYYKNNLVLEYLKPICRESALQMASLHKEVHGFNGMLGSIDCMHVFWDNCSIFKKGSTTSG